MRSLLCDSWVFNIVLFRFRQLINCFLIPNPRVFFTWSRHVPARLGFARLIPCGLVFGPTQTGDGDGCHGHDGLPFPGAESSHESHDSLTAPSPCPCCLDSMNWKLREELNDDAGSHRVGVATVRVIEREPWGSRVRSAEGAFENAISAQRQQKHNRFHLAAKQQLPT